MKTVNKKLILSLCLLSGVGLMFEAGTVAAAISARASRAASTVNGNVRMMQLSCQKAIGMYRGFPIAEKNAQQIVASFQARDTVINVQQFCNLWYKACKNSITTPYCMTADHKQAVIPWGG